MATNKAKKEDKKSSYGASDITVLEGLEAVRNIRDEDFSNLEDGFHGLVIQDGVWRLTGEPDTTNIFSRQIEISAVDANTKKVVSTVSWMGMFQPGQMALATYFVNQQVPSP